MNMIASTTQYKPAEDAIGWRPNLKRLRREVELARNGRVLDPWALVEAECWLDLIQAELSASTTRSNPEIRAQLIGWRTEIARHRTTLEMLSADNKRVSGDNPEERGALTGLPHVSPSRQTSSIAANPHHQASNGERFNEISSAA